MRKSKGFTLIELLVVIAIIGILAAIVLVSLSSARNKAKDVRIQADIAQVRSIAEMIYSDDPTNGYTTMCASNTLNVSQANYGTQINRIATDVTAQGGGTVACVTSSTAYCASAKFNSGTNQYYCVDSTGQSKSAAGAACTSTACP